jgi:hypothetical protein
MTFSPNHGKNLSIAAYCRPARYPSVTIDRRAKTQASNFSLINSFPPKPSVHAALQENATICENVVFSCKAA